MTNNPVEARSRTAVVDLDTVVVGIDDDPTATLAWLGRQRIRRVQLVHAISPAVELLEAGFQVDVRSQVAASNERLGDLASELHQFVDEVSCQVVEDSIPSALTRAATSSGASAIVIGSGRRHGPGTLVGAEVGRVIHRSQLPVFVVPEREAVRPTPPHDADEVVRRVVVAVDEFGDAVPLLEWVHDAIAPDATVDVLAAVSPTVLAVADAPESMRSIERVLRHRLEELLPDGFRGDAGVEFQHPIDAYAEASTRASVLVLASRRRGRIEGVLTGSVVHHLPVISSCPIALVPLAER